MLTKTFSFVLFFVTTLSVILLFNAALCGQTCILGESPTDFCSSARVIDGNPGQHVVLMDVANATGGDTYCNANVGHTVWFEVTPTVSGPMTISTCHPATTYDTVLQVWLGGDSQCEFMEFLDCNDDADLPACWNSCSDTNPRSSQVTIDAIANARYRFSVGSYNNNSAGCPLCLGVIVTIGEPCGDPPVNLACPLARELPGDAGLHEAVVDVTDAVVLPAEPIPSCGVNVGHTVWFKVVPEVNGPLTFSSCHPNTTYDTIIQAYAGNCSGPLVILECNDDLDDPACLNNCDLINPRASSVSFFAEKGATYYFQVGSYNNNASGCVLCLGVNLTIVDICDGETTPPLTELTLPPALSCVCDPVTITGTATDPNGTFEGYILDYRPASGGSWTVINSSNTAVVNDVLGIWNTTGLPQGFYVVRLTARNICGLSSTDVKILWLGTTFDTLRIDSPGSGAVLGGNICVSGTVWDNYCFDTFNVEYQPLSGGPSWSPLTTVHNSTTRINQTLAVWDTLGDGIPDGDYRLRVSGYDTCGNNKIETVEPVTVDNTPALAVISSPTNCEFVEGIVPIVVTVNDAHVKNWALQYTGGPSNGWNTIATGTAAVNNLVVSWDTSGLPICAYTIRLLAWDQAVVNCSNTGTTHQSEYTVSVVVGLGFSADLNGDGKVNLLDFIIFSGQWLAGT